MINETNLDNWLKTFFEEKALENEAYVIEHQGNAHVIDTETVIDLITKASAGEKSAIVVTLRKIDFGNGDVHDFLKHLATGYIKANFTR